MILLNESLLDVRTKNASDLSDEQFKNILQYDPTLYNIDTDDTNAMSSSKESFSKWLIKQYNKNNLFNVKPENMRKALTMFSKLKNKPNLLTSNDINSYDSYDVLVKTIEDGLNNLTTNQKNKEAGKQAKELKTVKQPGKYLDGNVEFLFDGLEWEVWTPLSYEGSKALRKGADWCTGGDKRTYYDSYTEDGMLIVFINKAYPNTKYQVFLPFNDDYDTHSREFRNERNENNKRFKDFLFENDDIRQFFKSNEELKDLVELSYGDIDDPSSDEFTEGMEEEIVNDFGLAYNDNGQICYPVYFRDIIGKYKYTDPEDYVELCSSEMITNGNTTLMEEYCYEIIKENYEEVDWSDTDVEVLWKYYNENVDKITFETFKLVLFNGDVTNDKAKKLKKWLIYRYNKLNPDDSLGYVPTDIARYLYAVADCFSGNYGITEPITNFEWRQLMNLFNLSSKELSEYLQNNSNDKQNYDLLLPIDSGEIHTVEEFYNRYVVGKGYTNQHDLDGEFKIDDEKLNLSEVNWEAVRDDENYISDRIIRLFLTVKEYNDFEPSEIY